MTTELHVVEAELTSLIAADNAPADTDMIQKYSRRQKYAASEHNGHIDVTVIETLDFNAMTITCVGNGWHEGARVVNQTQVNQIDPIVTPERAARYRRQTGGYTRLK